jgi:hypothetical protein
MQIRAVEMSYLRVIQNPAFEILTFKLGNESFESPIPVIAIGRSSAPVRTNNLTITAYGCVWLTGNHFASERL